MSPVGAGRCVGSFSGKTVVHRIVLPRQGRTWAERRGEHFAEQIKLVPHRSAPTLICKGDMPAFEPCQIIFFDDFFFMGFDKDPRKLYKIDTVDRNHCRAICKIVLHKTLNMFRSTETQLIRP